MKFEFYYRRILDWLEVGTRIIGTKLGQGKWEGALKNIRRNMLNAFTDEVERSCYFAASG
jgi:hypothetical protein